MNKPKVKKARTPDLLAKLYERPGFLLRRANQIAVSLFLEETAELGITTTQYGAMVVLHARENLDQIGLAKWIGIDRSTAALVISKLAKAGYVARGRDLKDRRRHVLFLTRRGRDALNALVQPAERVRRLEMAIFSKEEAREFMRLLHKFVDSFNAKTRIPIVGKD